MTYEIYGSIVDALDEKDSYYSWDRGLPITEIENNLNELTKADLLKILSIMDCAIYQSADSNHIYNRVFDDFIDEFENEF